MTHADYFMTALCCWREARGEGAAGMLAVAWTIRNRSLRQKKAPYSIVTAPWQFSSITAPGDGNLGIFPVVDDLNWTLCTASAQLVLDGGGASIDPTLGATLYWNPNGITVAERAAAKFALQDGSEVWFPRTWNRAKVQETAVIGKHIFLREI